MKKLQIIIFFLLISVAATAQSGIEKYFPKKPNPPRLVIDDERLDLLTPEQEEALEKKLVTYDDSTSNQILIVTTADIGDYDISDYALELGRKWGVGNKDFNNGIIIVVLNNKERKERKVWIAVGYGLEGAIPDITAKQIIEYDILPNFKGQDYYGGLDEGTDDLIRAAAGEYKPPANYSNRKRKGEGSILVPIIIFIIIIIIFSNIKRGGGGMMSRRGYRRWDNTPSVWWFPSGGGGGGGWSGGGGSSGGFGGFGGGSFGGGGAGGSW
jgi:uncharacterized protein